jgi:hypothetical protein
MSSTLSERENILVSFRSPLPEGKGAFYRS